MMPTQQAKMQYLQEQIRALNSTKEFNQTIIAKLQLEIAKSNSKLDSVTEALFKVTQYGVDLENTLDSLIKVIKASKTIEPTDLLKKEIQKARKVFSRDK